jgi:ribosomal-protein-alanine N-acetyltransferase
MDHIATTDRLLLREVTVEDAAFMNRLLNSPGFLQYIGDRNVRTEEDAANFIEDRYRASYSQHGYGLWTVATKDGVPVGICGFVKRDHFELPDLGFAFLPEHSRKGYGYESAAAAMSYGQEKLGFSKVLAITTLDNIASIGLLEKLGFKFESLTDTPTGERVRLFSFTY